MYWGHQVGEDGQEESRGMAVHSNDIGVPFPWCSQREEQGGNLGLVTTRVSVSLHSHLCAPSEPGGKLRIADTLQ